MKSNFDACLKFTLQYEGGFVNHPRDPGGATNLGITRATLARWRGRPVTVSEVRNLKRDEAAAIYRKWYWDAVGGDTLPYGVDLMAFDIAVNMGPGRALTWLHETSNMRPTDRDDAMAVRRMGFWRRLKTWATFGRGWSARGRACQIEANRMQRTGYQP